MLLLGKVTSRFYLDEDVPIGLKHELIRVGHDAVYARDLHKERRTDGHHLLLASRERRILIAYNRKHFLLLHDAWKRWSHEWGIAHLHAGILCLAQASPAESFFPIDVFVRSSLPVDNELYTYDHTTSWVREPYQP